MELPLRRLSVLSRLPYFGIRTCHSSSVPCENMEELYPLLSCGGTEAQRGRHVFGG